jgi:hypothetical protein
MAANRIGFDRVLAKTLRAGTMASSNGNATVTPNPRKTSRREMCFFVMTIWPLAPSGVSFQFPVDCSKLPSVLLSPMRPLNWPLPTGH